MLFNSWEFLIFFPIFFLIYYLIPHKYKWIILLTSSYFFYMCWKLEYVVLLLISTSIDYILAIIIEETEELKKKRIFLYLSLFLNIGILFCFKYLNFFSTEIQNLLNIFNIEINLIHYDLLLPLGISFYTFQTLSYTFDVYNNKIKAERHWGRFALYVSFFPQLVAGPIERAGKLLPQFKNKISFNYKEVTDGFKLILWGFFKKIVIADSLAQGVNIIYDNPENFSGLALIIATVFFAFQIYCDFSGYSDIAIGLAQTIGIKLSINFKRPYHAKSITDFWKRWHISLTSWFKDYLYIPLGGNRVPIKRVYFNIFIVFLVSGLWHGANWTFIVWGVSHGFFYILTKVLSKKIIRFNAFVGLDRYPKIRNILGVAITFSFVCFSWVFFRADSLEDAFYVLGHMFQDIAFHDAGITLKMGKLWLAQSILLILFMEVIHLIARQKSMRAFLSEKPIYIRWPIYLFIIVLILLFGVFEEQEFIYFQF